MGRIISQQIPNKYGMTWNKVVCGRVNIVRNFWFTMGMEFLDTLLNPLMPHVPLLER
jgi:hypothetical protein